MKTMIDLTDRFPMKFAVEPMQAELALLENEKWLDHYDKALADGWTAIPLVSHDGSMNSTESQRIGKMGHYQRTAIVEKLPYFRSILDAFACPQGRIRIMKLLPGTIIKAHRDIADEVGCFAFNQVRLHIPIITNDKVVFRVGGEDLKLSPGRLYYVNFSKVHYVRNDGDAARTHLVMDLQVNDFLRNVFPELSPFERVENFVVRHTLPLWWQVQFARDGLERAFWQNYEGSALQRLRRRLRKASGPRGGQTA
jgi:hypothetical protein